MLQPKIFTKINNQLDTLFSTKKVERALDSRHSIDQWVIENNIVVGGALFLGSCFLVVLFFAMMNWV